MTWIFFCGGGGFFKGASFSEPAGHAGYPEVWCHTELDAMNRVIVLEAAETCCSCLWSRRVFDWPAGLLAPPDVSGEGGQGGLFRKHRPNLKESRGNKVGPTFVWTDLKPSWASPRQREEDVGAQFPVS